MDKRQSLWVMLLTIAVVLVMAIAGVPAARGEINHREDPSGQLVYESHQTLVDRQGRQWETRLFQHFQRDGDADLCLQLTGQMGNVTIARNRPLQLTLSNGEVIQAPDTSCDIFPNASPAPHLAQYHLQSFTSQLQLTTALHLSIPVVDGDAIEIDVPQAVLEEWKAIVSCSALYCDS